MAIFDLDKTSTHRVTRNFLDKAQKNNIIFSVTDDIPRSFIVTSKKGKTMVYLSQLSPSTLKERMEN